MPRGLSPAGAVLGVDVGYSETASSSAVCRLDWDSARIGWTARRFRALPAEREDAIVAVAGGRRLEAAAFDGPLRPGFDVIGRYRTAERMLTRRLGARIGKPGQSSAPVGKRLNAAANACVAVVLDRCELAPATHPVSIDARAVVEAFPTAFLGVTLADPAAVPANRSDRSKVYFRHLAEDGTLQALLAHLLPGRELSLAPAGVTNPDEQAALVCALTALSVAAGDFTAVGDAADGWIVLPPPRFVQGWARLDLEANARDEQPGCLHPKPPEPRTPQSEGGTRGSVAGSEVLVLARAYALAAERHAAQRRKGSAAEPYINHLAEVAALVAEATDGRDAGLVAAAVLHDVLEDTATTEAELAAAFGGRVAALVREVTDDRALTKAERKRRQVLDAPGKSAAAKTIKLADKTSNLRALVESPPEDWDPERRRAYLRWAREVAAGLRGASPPLEAAFDEAALALERALGGAGP
jgi:hypothetical protein